MRTRQQLKVNCVEGSLRPALTLKQLTVGSCKNAQMLVSQTRM